jgi:beta-lactamase class A
LHHNAHVPAVAALPPPVLVAPAPHEASFGRVAGTAPGGTVRIVVRVDGALRASLPFRGRTFDLRVELPRREVRVQVTAVGREGRASTATVAHVLGLPRASRPTGAAGWEHGALAARVRSLARGFGHSCAVYVQDLATGAGAAWNARARFPAASTLKLAIAVEALRSLGGKPPPGSRLDRLLRSMIVYSDNGAANEVETIFGGSTSGGSARVNALLRSLGLVDTEMYGGYERETAARRKPLPLRVDDAPYWGYGKHSSAFDLARLLRYVYLAADGRGPLLRRSLRPADARYLLYLLASVRDRGKLDRFLGGRARVLHKGGWVARARHDNGIVVWKGGALVVTVMTFRAGGAGASSDVLAGRVAASALEILRRKR